jgi:hypothetical protein
MLNSNVLEDVSTGLQRVLHDALVLLVKASNFASSIVTGFEEIPCRVESTLERVNSNSIASLPTATRPKFVPEGLGCQSCISISQTSKALVRI